MLHRKFVIMVTLALASLAFAVTFAAGPAQATTRTVRHTMRSLAYKYAVAQRGKWYCWGGAGPSCYDCSGLVYAAYRHVHIWLGRTTYDMLHSGRLIRIRHFQVRAWGPGLLRHRACGTSFRPAQYVRCSRSRQPDRLDQDQRVLAPHCLLPGQGRAAQ